MKEGRLYKAIKSDPGLLITIIFAVGSITLGYSSLMNKIDNLSDAVSGSTQESKETKMAQATKDQSQDTAIVQNSVDIGNIKGSLSQRGIYVRQVDVRAITSTSTQYEPAY